MYLVLSAFNARPISIILANKASAFFYPVCTLSLTLTCSRALSLVLSCIVVGLAVCIVVVVLCVLLSPYVYLLYCVCIPVFFLL